MQYGVNGVLCLDNDLKLLFSIQSGERSRSMAQGSDGSVWLCTGGVGSYTAARIDEDGTLAEKHQLPQNGGTLMSATAESGHLFYIADSNAVYGATLDEDGELTLEATLGLVSSGILMQTSGDSASGIVQDGTSVPIAAYPDGSFLFMRFEDGVPYPTMYRPDSTEVTEEEGYTLTIAQTLELTANDLEILVEFRRTHPNVELVVRDYTVYNEGVDTSTGEEKLAFDMVNGFLTPDVIIGNANGVTMEQLLKKKLYTNLTPYLEKDEYVNLDNLMSCIPRIFDDGDGGMWGISPRFRATTLVTTRDYLEQCGAGEKGHLTLEELLDLLEKVPDGSYGMTDALAWSSLTANGYAYFVDTEAGGATFDSELFCRYITYLSTLPKDYTEYKRSGSYGGLTTEEQLTAHIEGRVAFEQVSLEHPNHLTELNYLFLTNDYVPTGYATKGESGTIVKASGALAITTFASHPDICWELLRGFFTEYDSGSTGHTPTSLDRGLSSMRSLLREEMLEYTVLDSIFYFDGDRDYHERDSESPITSESLTKPGVVVEFTETDVEKILDFLDEAGEAALTVTETKSIDGIVTEELSAYFSGVGTAEDCAAKIQSRVSIWLAEH